MQLDGGLVQVRLDADPLGLDPVEVARRAVEANPVVMVVAAAADVEVVVVVVHVAAAPTLLRQPYYGRIQAN